MRSRWNASDSTLGAALRFPVDRTTSSGRPVKLVSNHHQIAQRLEVGRHEDNQTSHRFDHFGMQLAENLSCRFDVGPREVFSLRGRDPRDALLIRLSRCDMFVNLTPHRGAVAISSGLASFGLVIAEPGKGSATPTAAPPAAAARLGREIRGARDPREVQTCSGVACYARCKLGSCGGPSYGSG